MRATTFTETLQAEVASLQSRHPILAGQLDKAFALVVNGAVFPLEDGHTAHVRSQRDPDTAYLVNGRCTCKSSEYRTEPCAHRFAFRLYQRVSARLTVDSEERWEPVHEEHAPRERPTSPAPTLPEAPASCNVYVLIGGHKVQVTLRDTDEHRMLARLQALLAQYPVPQPATPAPTPADTTPQCPKHGALKRSTRGKGWYCPTKNADGTWCPNKEKGGAA